MPQYPYKPNQNHSEMLVDQALMSAISDPETIRNIRPSSPQQLMPPRHGFSKQSLSIMDVLTIDRNFPTNRSWLSGAPVMFRNGFVDDSWEGSSRYSMQSLGA
jgi:hypothetical protein